MNAMMISYDDNDGYVGDNCHGGHSEEEKKMMMMMMMMMRVVEKRMTDLTAGKRTPIILTPSLVRPKITSSFL